MTATIRFSANITREKTMKVLLHDKVASQIECYIKDVSFDYNSRLPSIETLAKTFAVSKATCKRP